MQKRLQWTLWICALSATLLALPAQAEVIVGVTTTNQLITFNAATPGTIATAVTITGLQPGETLLGLDVRPATGQLYGLGTTSRVYVINPASGAATPVGSAPFTPALSGTNFGFDFNPVPDRIRVTSDTGQNLRLNPDTGAVAGTDTPLAYAAGDPNAGVPPNLVAVAYTNNARGAISTTLYGIDAGLNILVRQGSPEGAPTSPNSGQLFTVGPLNFSTSGVASFDISPGTGKPFAVLTVGGVPQLFTINLGTGAATLVGAVGRGFTLRGIAVAAFQRILVTGAGEGGGPRVRVFDDVTGGVRMDFFAYDPAFRGGVRVATCDVNGDGIPDIVTGAGPGAGPHVRVFDGLTGTQLPGIIGSFFAFDPAYLGGIRRMHRPQLRRPGRHHRGGGIRYRAARQGLRRRHGSPDHRKRAGQLLPL